MSPCLSKSRSDSAEESYFLDALRLIEHNSCESSCEYGYESKPHYTCSDKKTCVKPTSGELLKFRVPLLQIRYPTSKPISCQTDPWNWTWSQEKPWKSWSLEHGGFLMFPEIEVPPYHLTASASAWSLAASARRVCVGPQIGSPTDPMVCQGYHNFRRPESWPY